MLGRNHITAGLWKWHLNEGLLMYDVKVLGKLNDFPKFIKAPLFYIP
jgi:hypothetical protein